MKYKSLPKEEKWILKGIIILFIIGSLLHSLYDICGKNLLFAFIAPVNESIFEHLKMVTLPLIAWWSIYYILNKNKNGINKDKWFTGLLISLITSIITIPLLFYFYTGAFGFESMVIDILILFLALLFGQLIGLHFYRYFNGFKWYISLGISLIIVLIFIYLTFNPISLPIFKDGVTGGYGII